MTPNPSTLLAPASSAFPRYSGVFSALATLMASDAPVVPPPPTPTPTPSPIPTPTPPLTPAPPPPAGTILAGRYVMLGGSGAVCSFDFGDPTASYNTLRGYNAAHVYDTPGNYVTTVTPAGQTPVKTNITIVPDTRPRITLAADADLAAVLAGTKSPTVYLLPAGATFDIKMPATISADGVTLRAAPSIAPATSAASTTSSQASAAPRIRRIAAAGVYSTLIVSGSDVSIEGIEFDSDQPLKATANIKVGIYAINIEGNNLLVRNCTFRNVDDGLHCQPKARGLVVVGCQFTNELRACAVYLDAAQNAVVLGIHAVGSICEHIVRLEGAANVLIHGSDMDNRDGKETVAIRMGSFVAVVNNTVRAWARISEGIGAQPGTYCRNILFAANHFTTLRPIGPLMQVNPGSQTVVFDSNTFDVDATQVAIAVQAPVTDLRFTNNQLALVNGAKTCRALIDPFGNPTLTETGTTTLAARAA